MKRLTVLTLVCLFALVPTRARADDGGWWDWLWSWDPKFVGASSEIHLLCLDDNGRKIFGCEELYTRLWDSLLGKPIVHHFSVTGDPGAPQLPPIQFEDIRHEIDFRFGYHHNFGDRYHTPETTGEARETLSAQGSINVLKLMGMYHYRFNEYVAVGGGLGFLTIYGEGFSVFSRGILTPVSFLVYPLPHWKAFALRPEVNYIPQGFKAADFGDNPTKFSYSNTNEWNLSIAVGFDLRRTGTFR